MLDPINIAFLCAVAIVFIVVFVCLGAFLFLDGSEKRAALKKELDDIELW